MKKVLAQITTNTYDLWAKKGKARIIKLGFVSARWNVNLEDSILEECPKNANAYIAGEDHGVIELNNRRFTSPLVSNNYCPVIYCRIKDKKYER
jgi:hypothetical protein